MVADALQVLGDHQQVDAHLAVVPLADEADQLVLHVQEQLVDLVVLADHALGQLQVFAHIGVNAVGDHADDAAGHLRNGHPAGEGTVGNEAGDLGDVRGLIADALHVGDHLQGRRNGTQVTGHRLLLQQQLHAQVFNVPLLLIDLPLGRHGGFPKIVVLIQQGLGGGGDTLLAQSTHPDELYIQLLQLFVEFVPHYPNLPVM